MVLLCDKIKKIKLSRLKPEEIWLINILENVKRIDNDFYLDDKFIFSYNSSLKSISYDYDFYFNSKIGLDNFLLQHYKNILNLDVNSVYIIFKTD